MYFSQVTTQLNSSMFDSLLKVRALDDIPMTGDVSVGSLKLSWLSFALVVVAERKESSRDDRKLRRENREDKEE